MSAQENLNSAQFKPEHLEYTPRSWSDLSMGTDHNNKPFVVGYHPTNPRTGFAYANHEVTAVHPEHGVVGKAGWSDTGNIHVQVNQEFRRKGIGMRLVDEAHKHDPVAALRGLTPVSPAGVEMAKKVQKTYGVKDA